MPSRKQKRRQAKEKRHEHEFVWVDSQGNPLEEQPDEPASASKQRNGTAPATQQRGKSQPQKGGRTARVPQPPSWPRAAKRAAILGVVVFVIFSFGASRSHHGYITAIIPAVIYTALFVPFTYVIDRYAYNRYLAKTQQGGAAPKKQPPKKN